MEGGAVIPSHLCGADNVAITHHSATRAAKHLHGLSYFFPPRRPGISVRLCPASSRPLQHIMQGRLGRAG